FSPDGTRFVSAGSDQTLRAWDATIGEEVFEFPPAAGEQMRRFLERSGESVEVAFHPDGERLAVRYPDGTLIVRDVFTGRELFSLSAVGARLTDAAFSPDGKELVTGSDARRPRPAAGAGGELAVWDARTGLR